MMYPEDAWVLARGAERDFALCPLSGGENYMMQNERED